MQSSNFVEGVSGWRIANGRIELYGGEAPIILEKAPEPGQPFVVADGATYINEAIIKDASIPKTKIADNWSVTMETTAGGQKCVAGIGVGIDQFVVDADRFGVTSDGMADMERAIKSGNACEILDMLASNISKNKLGADLKNPIADHVRDVLRDELKPGGMLYIAIRNR
ncbi:MULTISPECIES: phage tail tip fiber protein [unclassified Pseudomonas]|uniref:phage tail tip fiber protein n=1 Tax=unclassified Pseudomonas TaxID=196821 RepID=UPI000CD122A0|nr:MULTISPECIES: DUF1983 domain-containing protein [unclassified Pseudomonas]POA52115.1 hypothetical protein C1889_24270 [Pseudomonas sp. FW507-12TSA]